MEELEELYTEEFDFLDGETLTFFQGQKFEVDGIVYINPKFEGGNHFTIANSQLMFTLKSDTYY